MKKQEELDASLKLLVKTSLIVLVGVILSKIFTYLYRVIIARYFGPEVYGIFSLATIILGFFVSFASLGFYEGLLRYTSIYRGKNETEKIRYLFRLSNYVLFFSSLIAAVILYFSSEIISIKIFHDISLIPFLKIFSFLVPASVLSSIYLSTLRAFEKVKEQIAIANILQNFFKVMFLAVFILVGIKSNAVIFSYSISVLITFFLSYLFCKYKIPQIFEKSYLKSNEKQDISRKLYHYSIPLLFFGIISSIFYWIDSFSIGYFKGAYEVGIYNAAVPIALLLGITSDLFLQLFFPLITKEYSKRRMKIIEELSKQVAKWIFIINLPVFIILFLFPGVPLHLLFGEEYIIAADALRILSVGIFISCTFVVSEQLVSMAGKSKLVLLNIFLASILNFVLNAIFIPMDKILWLNNQYGINGAAIATVISLFFFYTLFLIQSWHYLKIIPLRRKMMSVLIASLIPTLILFYLRNSFEINTASLIAISIIFVSVYFLIILLIKGFDKNDLLIINSIRKKVYSN